MKKSISNFSALALFLLIVLIANLSAQTPQHYNYNNGTSSNVFPFSVTAGKKVQTLILSNNFNQPTPVPSGQEITKLYIRMSGTATVTFTDLCIKFDQSTITALPSGQIYTSSTLDTVYFHSSVTLSSTTNQWMSITLDRPYTYDTSKSLIIDISQCGASVTGMSIWNSVLTGTRRNYINGSTSCTFTYVGQDASVMNCGVDVSPVAFSCEGFEEASFPPPGWTVSGTGASYLAQRTPGFNSAHSVRFNSWTAPSGDIANFITPTFTTPSSSGDLIGFAYAYCPYYTSNDHLIILTSTDNGTSFTTLTTLNDTELTTTTNCNNAEYTPGSDAEWGYINIPLPAGTNKLNFEFVSAFGNDIWFDSACITNITGIHRLDQIAKVFSLSQNYPNPFNPITKINYSIPKPSLVKLEVFDILGAKVATLVNENKQPGNYSVTFNGSNLASGVYFYKITAGDFIDVKKMALIK